MNNSQIQSILTPGKKIVITTHKSPDGDALGSSLALQHILQKKQCHVSIVVPNDFPDFFVQVRKRFSFIQFSGDHK